MRIFGGRDLDERRASRRFGLSCPEASLTLQSQKDAADINVIVKRFGITGQLPVRIDALNLGAFEGVFDYQTAMNAVVAADRAFMTVPPELRARFGHDPQKFVEFVTNPQNEDECRKLKLWNPKVEEPPEVIQKVEVVAGLVPGAGGPPAKPA